MKWSLLLLASVCLGWTTFTTKLLSTSNSPQNSFGLIKGTYNSQYCNCRQSLLSLPQIPNLALARLERVTEEGRILQLFLRHQIPFMTVKSSSNHWHCSFGFPSKRHSRDFSLETHTRNLLYGSVLGQYSFAQTKHHLLESSEYLKHWIP